MSFARLLPFLMLLPALVFADVDRNFKILPQYFHAGEIVDSIANMVVEMRQGVTVSERPIFPLKENTLYLRHKVEPKAYHWFTGDIRVENFGKLHAFSLKANHLSSSEVAMLRFYASMNAKAFQDEADLYFDREYLYSPRLEKLYFMKNGRWQMLKQTELPGMISFSGKEPNFQVASLEIAYPEVPKILFPLRAGAYSFIFVAPGYFPYVDIDILKPGKKLVFETRFLPLPQRDTTDAPFPVSVQNVEAAYNLEMTEEVFDRFVEALENVSIHVNVMEFEKIYPTPKSHIGLGLNAKDTAYTAYVTRYQAKKDESLQMWRELKMNGVSEVNKALRQKLDSLQALPARVELKPDRVSLLRHVNKNTPTLLKLHFGATRERHEVTWVGSVDGYFADSLAIWLKSGKPKVTTVLGLQNDKPVWVYDKGKILGRYQYRYVTLDFKIGSVERTGVGTFTLPDYVLNEPEVQEWLHPKKPEVVVVDTVQKPVKAEPSNIVRDSLRGEIALVDSGSFRFWGRVVSLSPYAIMTTEMTQERFAKIMSTQDSSKRFMDLSSHKAPAKPVHNISWDKARMVCQMTGGDLPTEAQWEFAGRTGYNEGAPWLRDPYYDPGQYAVFRDNSYLLNSSESGFGPQPVASKKPNAWGIYDMTGNVAEWTRDRYFPFSFWIESSNPTGAMMGYSRIFKGGSWKDEDLRLNMTLREDEDPRYWSESIGFRCVYPRSLFEGNNEKH